jgi:hypothetical protein
MSLAGRSGFEVSRLLFRKFPYMAQFEILQTRFLGFQFFPFSSTCRCKKVGCVGGLLGSGPQVFVDEKRRQVVGDLLGEKRALRCKEIWKASKSLFAALRISTMG